MNAIELKQGNDSFRATAAYEGLKLMPRRRLVIIGCADPRVDPEKILGLELGDAAVVRNLGGRVTAPTLATIAGLARVGARQGAATPGLDVVVLQHTDCGILRLADEPEALAGFLGTDVRQLPQMHVRDPFAAVEHDVSILRSLGLPGVRVWGLVYLVATGEIVIATPPEALPS